MDKIILLIIKLTMVSKKMIFPALIIVAAGGIVSIKPLATLAKDFNLDPVQVQATIDEFKAEQEQITSRSKLT
jgi:hypothetical protein